MKKIFSKSSFPEAPGGDRYEWKDVETSFVVTQNGFFVVVITANAKNAYQNKSTDDDDLRIALDGYSFGKYEQHKEKISWKGFGTSASWDGSSLKGGTKTIYFFAELEKGEHKIQFFADMKPKLISLEIFKIENESFELKNLKPSENIDSDLKGIPWMSFIFLGSHPKNFLIDVNTKSAEEKGGTDGDNLKVIVNGKKIFKNERVPSSKKYQNFYFAGDIKSPGVLGITNEDFAQDLAFENSVELWYDQEPEIAKLKIDFFDIEEFLEDFDMTNLRKYFTGWAWAAIIYFRSRFHRYSAIFLQHALEQNPKALIFQSNHPIVRKIKRDPVYEKILAKLKDKILEGNIEGEIWPEDFKKDNQMNGEINFDSSDLATSIHGIHKIEYVAKKRKNKNFEVKFVLFDVYDFKRTNIPFSMVHLLNVIENKILNVIDIGENFKAINNFEIEINIKATI